MGKGSTGGARESLRTAVIFVLCAAVVTTKPFLWTGFGVESRSGRARSGKANPGQCRPFSPFDANCYSFSENMGSEKLSFGFWPVELTYRRTLPIPLRLSPSQRNF